MSWTRTIVILQTFEVAYGCINNGNFECTKAWYFWFAIFWAFFVMFVAGICIMNKCSNKKVAADLMSPDPKKIRKRHLKSKRHSSINGSVGSQATASTIVSPLPGSPMDTLNTNHVTHSPRAITPTNRGRIAGPNTPTSPFRIFQTSSPTPSRGHTPNTNHTTGLSAKNKLKISPLAVEETNNKLDSTPVSKDEPLSVIDVTSAHDQVIDITNE